MPRCSCPACSLQCCRVTLSSWHADVLVLCRCMHRLSP
jgi:hypothetical protein